MRERILRRVDFPAPFLPMMPTTSPFLTSKLMSLRARKVSRWGRRKGWRRVSRMVSARLERAEPLWTSVYCLLRSRTETESSIDDIGEGTFEAAEDHGAGEEEREGHGGGVEDHPGFGERGFEDAPAPETQEAGEGVEFEEHAGFA